MNEIPNPSRRHHHVWQHYLSPWTEGGAIWCLQSGKKIYNPGTTVVAVEKDFYRIYNLSDDELEFLDITFKNSHPLAQEVIDFLLTKLLRPFVLLQKVRRENNSKMEQLLSAFSERWAFEALEMHHSNVENEAIPLLDMALKGDISFIDDDRAIHFYHYLATQHIRTKPIKDRMISSFQNIGIDVSRVWNIMIPMCAITLGASLYERRNLCPLSIIRNHTDIAFVTGDQPIMNLLHDGPDDENPPERLSLYYPISPDMALLIPEEGMAPIYPEIGITADEVVRLNEKLAEGCFQQIFGKSSSCLEWLGVFRHGKE